MTPLPKCLKCNKELKNPEGTYCQPHRYLHPNTERTVYKKGHRHSEQTLKKMSASRIGTKASEQTKKKMSLARKGRIVTEETREKIRVRLRGRKLSEEHKKKLSIVHSGKKLSIEHRKNISKSAPKGKDNFMWKDGISLKNKTERNLMMEKMEYKLWREAVFARDNYTCVWCGERSGNGHKVMLNADHIKPWSTNPELRLEVSNGRTLCISCHKKTGTWGRS